MPDAYIISEQLRVKIQITVKSAAFGDQANMPLKIRGI